MKKHEELGQKRIELIERLEIGMKGYKAAFQANELSSQNYWQRYISFQEKGLKEIETGI